MTLMLFCKGEVISFRFSQQEGILRITERFLGERQEKLLSPPIFPLPV